MNLAVTMHSPRLEGYLDPMRGLDFARIEALANDQERNLDAINQWKDHLTEVAVHAHRAAEIYASGGARRGNQRNGHV